MANCAYIDECGINKALVREYGYAPKGERVEGIRCGRRFHRLNVVGGSFGGKMVAAHCYEHSATGCVF